MSTGSDSVKTETVSENIDTTIVHDKQEFPFSWINWCCTSQTTLKDAEVKILQNIRAEFRTRHVNIGPVVGENDINVWTWSTNENASGTPLVLLHGLCSGLALWVLNFDEISSNINRPMYAIDVPGFGRSSRPDFSTDPKEAEQQFVKMIEAWRATVGLKRMILLGHSFGGYISFSYSISYPERIAHLICTDPWGFSEKTDIGVLARVPCHKRTVARIMDYFQVRPMSPVRFLGPLGEAVIRQIRGKDLIPHFEESMHDPLSSISHYIFHCNAQTPTGEDAFVTLMSTYGWAKNPMHLRINDLDQGIPLTLIYGSRSWIDHYSPEEIVRRRSSSFVDFHILDAGHHVYAEKATEFNLIVRKVCSLTEDKFVTLSSIRN